MVQYLERWWTRYESNSNFFDINKILISFFFKKQKSLNNLSKEEWKELRLPPGIKGHLKKWASGQVKLKTSTNETLSPMPKPTSSPYNSPRFSQTKSSPNISPAKQERIDYKPQKFDIIPYLVNCLALLVWWIREEIFFHHSIKILEVAKHFAPVQYCIAYSENEIYFCFNFETPFNYIRQLIDKKLGNYFFFFLFFLKI